MKRRVSLESQPTAGGAIPAKEFVRIPNTSGKVTMGLVLGVVSLLVVLLIVVIPNLLRSRLNPQTSSTVGTLHTINTAEITYSTTYDHGFSPTLAALGCPKDATPNFKPSEKEAGLIDEFLASGTKGCYRYSYIPGPVDSGGKISTYMVHADPVEPCADSKIHYFTDQTRVIRSEKDMEAYASSPLNQYQ